MTTGNYFKLKGSKFISISGEDRGIFLQSLITNDIYKCSSKNPIYSCILSPQGKFIADFFIIEYQNSYVIEIHKNFMNLLVDKLNNYKLNAIIKINNLDNFLSLVISTNNKLLKFKKEIVNFKDPRKDNLGNKIYIPKNIFKEIIKKYNFVENSFDNYRELLIKNLIPFASEDLTPNKSLLLENNFDNINAIDWEKGCYVGQEITARMKYRALLKKQLYALKIITGKIKIGDEIKVNNIIIGKVVSKVNKYILCMLKIDIAKEKSKNKESIEINASVILKFL